MRLAPGTSEHRQRCESLVTLGRILSDKHPVCKPTFSASHTHAQRQ